MENLRETLKLLFLRQDAQKVVSNICLGGPSMVRKVDEDWFVYEFPESITSYSYEHKAQIYKLLCDEWMNVDAQIPYISYSHTPTIFNVLHKFTSSCLLVNEGILQCDFDSLLRWHDLSSRLSEDLLITSYYAGRDLNDGESRINFSWIPIVGHNNDELNEILSQPLADLHFHLLGSSYHFDISWMSVMNYPEYSLELFKKNKWLHRKGEGINKYMELDEIFILMIKACAIRQFLFHYIKGIDAPRDYDSLINDVLKIDEKGEEGQEAGDRSATGIISVIPSLQVALDSDIQSAFKYVRDDNDKTFVVDYALTENLVNVVKKNDPMYIFTVFAGERHLMYDLFKKIYEGSDEHIERIEQLFYAYLVIKSLVRQEMVLLNREIGLINYTEFDIRKIALSRRDYIELMKQMAIRSFYCRNENNYLEVRVQMKDDVRQLKGLIKDLDKSVNNGWFCKENVEKRLKFWYILSFEKRDDDASDEVAISSCRDSKLRGILRAQTIASADWKNQVGNDYSNRIVGIDAANTECNCRPEVFAQAYRYLRSYKPTEEMGGVDKYRFTYHVGEDFYDIVDGLRAIDEALRFLRFEKGDRLGHAMALGVNVKKYYQECNQTVVMQKQLLLDNSAWLLVYGENLHGYESVHKELVEIFKKYYQQIFNTNGLGDDYKTYFESWLLRGDDPTGYKELVDGLPKWTEVTAWSSVEKNVGKEYEQARNNPQACLLNQRYHYDVGVKKKGAEADELKISHKLVKYIEDIQCMMMYKVAVFGVNIECCPTSNIRVGPINKYREHPIFRFNSSGLSSNGSKNRNLPVSVNTDDKGIFATSLEREYSLLCLALLKDVEKEVTSNTPEMINGWIKMIRRNGIDHSFHGV